MFTYEIMVDKSCKSVKRSTSYVMFQLFVQRAVFYENW